MNRNYQKYHWQTFCTKKKSFLFGFLTHTISSDNKQFSTKKNLSMYPNTKDLNLSSLGGMQIEHRLSWLGGARSLCDLIWPVALRIYLC